MAGASTVARAVAGILLFAALPGRCVAAADVDYLPGPVQDAIVQAAGSCEGGLENPIVRRVERPGQPQPFYLVNYARACTAFCGSGGCTLTVFAADAGGIWRRAFDTTVRSYDLQPAAAGARLDVEFGGAECGRSNAEPCFRTFTLAGGRFVPAEKATATGSRPSIPLALQGRWSTSRDVCKEDSAEGVSVTVVESDGLGWYEIDCEVETLAPIGAGVRIGAVCVKGGGIESRGEISLAETGTGRMSLVSSGFTGFEGGSELFRCGAPAERPVVWNALHNGSLVSVTRLGERVEIRYLSPRPGMIEAGARPGDVVFSGRWQGGSIEGDAFIYSRACGVVPYRVAGRAGPPISTVALDGQAPRLDSACLVTGVRADRLVFEPAR